MKPFLIKTLVFIAFLVLFKTLLLLVNVTTFSTIGLNNYYGKQSEKPKLLLVGGSNLDYNYDYSFLNNEITQYDVVGCNLNEPSGLFATVTKLQRLKLTSSDLVVFCFPHSFYESKKFLPIRSYKKVGFSLGTIANSAKYFPVETFSAIFIDNKVEDIFEIYSEKTFPIDKDVKPIKFRRINNKENDSHYSNCTEPLKKGPFLIKSYGFEKTYIERVLSYFENELPCQFVFRFPPALTDEYEINSERLVFLSDKLKFINTFESAIYRYDDFHNQTYHLNRCGRDLCTENLVLELRRSGCLK
jgi:hypothetical protein